MWSSLRNKLAKPSRGRLAHIGISPSSVCLRAGKKNVLLCMDTAQLQSAQRSLNVAGHVWRVVATSRNVAQQSIFGTTQSPVTLIHRRVY